MKTHKGACHCGAVAYEAELDLGQVIECDCTHCYAKGFQLSFTTPDRFRLLSGQERLTKYQFNHHVIDHLFCSTCGVQPLGRGTGPDGREMVAVNIRTLQDVETYSVATQRFPGRAKL